MITNNIQATTFHDSPTARKLYQNIYKIKYPTTPIQVHIDGGANRSITNNISILTQFRNIKKYAINGVSNDGPALYCTGVGYIPWHANTGETLYSKCYYSPQAADTIISPTDVVTLHIQEYHAWEQYNDIDRGPGTIRFHSRNCAKPVEYEIHMKNGLWFHNGPNYTQHDYHQQQYGTHPITRCMTTAALYELYHQRFGHPGERIMIQLHKHVDDVPQLCGNAFYKCKSCAHAKSKQTTKL
jgi:hypothetical protein